MKAGKRHLILAALVLALGTAVYLNWQFSSNNDLFSTETIVSTKELGEAQFVNNVPENKSTDNKNQIGKSSEYFTKAKSTRQKARDEATDMIKEILENTSSTEETKSQAIKQASEIARNIEQESNIESLIRAKGFSECLVFIQNNECSVVVGPEPLNENLALNIKDVVVGQSNILSDKIKILEAK